MRMPRLVLASGLLGVSAVCMQSWDGDPPWQLLIPTGLLGLSALLCFHRSSASQLLVRAVLWSNLLLAALVAWISSGHDRPVAAVLGAATGLALLVLGRQGLDDEKGAFVPVAFRGTLTALLVMALADAQTLLFWGSILAEPLSPERTTGIFTLAIAAVFAIGVVGIYRLRAWGLLLTSLAAICLLVLVTRGVFAELRAFQLLFAGSAALQLALAIPLYLALVRGAPRSATISRRGVWLSSIAVEILMLTAMVPTLSRLFE